MYTYIYIYIYVCACVCLYDYICVCVYWYHQLCTNLDFPFFSWHGSPAGHHCPAKYDILKSFVIDNKEISTFLQTFLPNSITDAYSVLYIMSTELSNVNWIKQHYHKKLQVVTSISTVTSHLTLIAVVALCGCGPGAREKNWAPTKWWHIFI